MYRCTKFRLNLESMATAARVSVLYILPVPDSISRGIGEQIVVLNLVRGRSEIPTLESTKFSTNESP